jgi:hypothetical protein
VNRSAELRAGDEADVCKESGKLPAALVVAMFSLEVTPAPNPLIRTSLGPAGTFS